MKERKAAAGWPCFISLILINFLSSFLWPSRLLWIEKKQKSSLNSYYLNLHYPVRWMCVCISAIFSSSFSATTSMHILNYILYRQYSATSNCHVFCGKVFILSGQNERPSALICRNKAICFLNRNFASLKLMLGTQKYTGRNTAFSACGVSAL